MPSTTLRRVLSVSSALALVSFGTGCGKVDKMLAEQADQVCACDTYECGMGVLDGPINQKLKALDKGSGGTVKLSDKGRREKARMMSCLLSLKAKDAEPSTTTTTSASPAVPTPSSLTSAFRSAGGDYSVTFPLGTPEQTVTTDNKGVRWNEAKSSIGLYVVGYADFASPAAAQAFSASFVKSLEARTTSNQPITLGTARGRELQVTVSPTATLWMRLYPVGKRLYKVSAGTKNDRAKAYAFLDTFNVSR